MTATEYSKCADSEPSRVRAVQPSASSLTPACPALTIGSIARTNPGLSFGPRPGDLAAFNALGATDEARLTAYVDQQLNPAAIDDSAFARL